MKKPSTLFLHEIEGYLFGLTFFAGLIGIVYVTGTLGLSQTATNVINLFGIALLVMFAWQYRTYVIGQPKKTHAHIVQIFENEKSAWEIHGVVERIIPVSPKDPVYAEAMKPFDLQNRYLYLVKYAHVTVIGNNPFEFKTAALFTDTPIDELYGQGIPHEILYKGFAAPVAAAFLVFDLLRIHQVDAVKGMMDRETIPVFNVRKGHIHSRYDKRFQDLPQADVKMLNTEKVIMVAATVNMQRQLIEAKAEARDEGVKISRREGGALGEAYMEGNKVPMGMPSLRSHPKLLGTIIGLGILMFAASLFLGWVRF